MAWWWRSKRSDTATAPAETAAQGASAPPHLVRPVEPRDDAALADILRSVMTEFGVTGAGTSIDDPEVRAMSATYSAPRSAYFVVESAGRVVGGGGIGPLQGGEFELCELRKMYLLPDARGQGAGGRVLNQCLRAARGFGYRACYLETATGMNGAQTLYAKTGFRPLPKPVGATGHFGCDRYFALELS
jgi:putative acetyltransferase